MAELLLRGIDNEGPDDIAFKKGDVVSVLPDGGSQQKAITAPNFSVITISDTTPEEAAFWGESWIFFTGFDDISVDPVTDSARVSMFHINPGESNRFPMTREVAEPQFNWWGAIFANEQQNDIRFDALVLNAYSSNGFWGRGSPEDDAGPLPFTLTETDYDQASRTHTATIDNDQSGMSWGTVKTWVELRGGSLSEPIGNQAVMTITGDAVVTAMKEDIEGNLHRTLVTRRYYVDPATVNVIQALPDNTLSLTPEQAALQILDKTDI